MNTLLEKARTLLNKEQIKIQVMLSLMLKLVLIFSAPLRKRSSNKRLLLLLWLAYLGADYVATLALGSILTNTFQNAGVDLPEQSLITFWAPFLLLHLGGPDNITSYSIEDNELWLRHFLGFVVQTSVALLVLVQAMLHTTRLLVPSILIFIVGTIKFGERTIALRAASTQQIKKSTVHPDLLQIKPTSGFQYIKRPNLVDLEQDTKLNEETLDMSDVKFILKAYIYFLVFKPHIVGTFATYSLHVFHLGVHKVVRDFKFIGIELSFFYDILHTKATVIHRITCRVIRIASLVSTATALVLFHISEKGGYESSDLIITYILLSVALFLEIYSALNLVASKWMTISLLQLNKRWSVNLAGYISRAKNHIFSRGIKGCWSGRLGQYSLIQSFIKVDRGSNWFKKACEFLFGCEEGVEVSDVLEKIVIKHVENIFKTWTSYGDLLRKIRSSWINNTLDKYNLTEIKDIMNPKAFDECVMAWHMATEICYFVSNNVPADSEEGRMREAMYRISKYMMYLLMERSSMMPPGIAETRKVQTIRMGRHLFHNSRHVRQACIFIYAKEIKPSGLPQLSVIPLVSQLVKNLKEIAMTSEERQWEIIRDAWMEMLTFVAVRCSPTEHARGLSRGGEFLTHYWLLLAHYGIMEDYNASELFWRLATETYIEIWTRESEPYC